MSTSEETTTSQLQSEQLQHEQNQQLTNQQESQLKQRQHTKQDNISKVQLSDGLSSLGLQVKKDENFSKWYQQLVQRTELIDYYDISGCYILRPWAYEIWEYVQTFLDTEFKKLGVKNTYFPMFVPKKNLETEKDHIEGFSAEVAWVTHSGSTQLDEPIAIRPTSETIMYPTFSKWIKSHRDLPLRLNQWCNVVRWEFKDPTPFIRTREILWQGHTAHSTLDSAAKEVLQILDIYERVYEEILCCSVIKGKKTEYEKFAGSEYTTTVEGYIPGTGRAIQAATSHCLGQKFSKMFNIQYQNENGSTEYVWQNSWGFSTRSLGVLFMTHGDDKGLILPPKVAPIQVVLIPITKAENAIGVTTAINNLANELKLKGIRIEVDDRTNVSPGFKYNHWELKGVPLRVEIGGRDLNNKTAVIVRRDLGTKQLISWDNFGTTIEGILDSVQNDLRIKAKNLHTAAIKQVRKWDEFMIALQNNHIGLLAWCGNGDCEELIKKQSALDAEKFGGDKTGAAKSLCIPFEQPKDDISKECCIKCNKTALHWVLFGRSY